MHRRVSDLWIDDGPRDGVYPAWPEPRAENLADTSVWVDATGKVTPIKELSRFHLENIIRFLEGGSKHPSSQDHKIHELRVELAVRKAGVPKSESKETKEPEAMPKKSRPYKTNTNRPILNLSGDHATTVQFFRTMDGCVWLYHEDYETVILVSKPQNVTPGVCDYGGTPAELWTQYEYTEVFDHSHNPDYVPEEDDPYARGLIVYGARVAAPIVVEDVTDEPGVKLRDIPIGGYFMYKDELYQMRSGGSNDPLLNVLNLETAGLRTLGSDTVVEPVELTVTKKG